jgi:hypothetical protein
MIPLNWKINCPSLIKTSLFAYYNNNTLDDDFDISKIRLLDDEGEDWTDYFSITEIKDNIPASVGTNRGTTSLFNGLEDISYNNKSAMPNYGGIK